MENNDREVPTDMSMTSIQRGWKNAPSYQDLYNDVANSSTALEEHRDNLLKWKETKEGGPVARSKTPGKSITRPLLVRKQNEWKYPALEEPFLNTDRMFEISPRTFEDADSARKNALVLNKQWNTDINKVKLVNDIVRTNVDDGTVIVKTGWLAEYGESIVEKEEPVYASPEESYQLLQEDVASGKMTEEQAQAMLEMGEPYQTGTKKVYVTEETLIENRPTYEVVNSAYVSIDPTCDGIIADAKFLTHEYDTDWATLKKHEYKVDEQGNSTGYYHNLEFVHGEESYVSDEHESKDSVDFRFQDKARKRIRATEYWGKWDIQGDGVLVSIVATWINGVMIRLEENPFPHKRIPFSLATYMPVKKEIHGEPDAEILESNQEQIRIMTRAINDVTLETAVGQTFIDENFFPSPSQKANYEKGNTVYYRSGFDPKTAVHRQAIQEVGQTPFNIIAKETADAQELSGTRAFAGGNASATLEGNVAAQRSAMDATSKRELSILRRLSELFKDMARMTISMNQTFLSESEVIRVTNEEFVEVRRDDLAGNFDLIINVSTPEKDNETAQRLTMLLQTNAASMDPALTTTVWADIAELWNRPDLAEKMRNFTPAKDPQQEALMALQIENIKLENAKLMKEMEEMDSRIIERLSRASENETADRPKKLAEAEEASANAQTALAKAEKERAMANKYQEEADAIAQEFLRVQDGTKQEEEVAHKAFDAKLKADAKRMDFEAGIATQALNKYTERDNT
jgi:hypothetical protein